MRLFLPIFFILAVSAQAQEANIYFRTNSYQLRSNDVEKIIRIAADYKQSLFTVVLTGHADTLGSASSNFDLSKRRTHAVQSLLIRMGVPASAIRELHKGEAEAYHSNQLYNRRVHIVLEKEEQVFTSTEAYLKSFTPQTQIFKANTAEETILEGSKGTIITIPPNVFQDKNGNAVTGPVDLELKEYYSISEFISNGLNTICDGNLLTSGGMVDLAARQNGEEVFLKPSSEIELAFPKFSEDRFYTFYGDTLPNGEIGWKLDEDLYQAKQQSVGVYIDENGEFVVTDRATASRRSKNLVFDVKTGLFSQLSDQDLSKWKDSMERETELYLEEQRIMDSNYQAYFNILSSRKLRLINCDEFIRDPSAVPVEYLVSSEGVKPDKAFLVYSKSKSLLSLTRRGDGFYTYARLPINYETRLLLISIKEGKHYCYFEKIKLKPKTVQTVQLREISKADLDQIMKSL